MTRQRKAAGDAYEPSLPDVGDAGYLLSLLNEAGQVASGGMGITGLTWTEINSWLSTVELSLTTWEKLIIYKMSQAYAGEYSAASDVNRQEPFIQIVAEEEIDRVAVASRIRNVLRSLMR